MSFFGIRLRISDGHGQGHSDLRDMPFKFGSPKEREWLRKRPEYGAKWHKRADKPLLLLEARAAINDPKRPLSEEEEEQLKAHLAQKTSKKRASSDRVIATEESYWQPAEEDEKQAKSKRAKKEAEEIRATLVYGEDEDDGHWYVDNKTGDQIYSCYEEVVVYYAGGKNRRRVSMETGSCDNEGMGTFEDIKTGIDELGLTPRTLFEVNGKLPNDVRIRGGRIFVQNDAWDAAMEYHRRFIRTYWDQVIIWTSTDSTLNILQCFC